MHNYKETGFPDIAAYCASKFDMIGLTGSLAW
jgi:NAD(P)-dependent dehydrogenase (short-subunit alcohol dehydrogenase family)